MKAFRILLIAAFILVGRSTMAQAASDRVGFVALLSKVDPNAPIQSQTEQAMNRLLPALLAAQRAGQILEFQPELSAGILKLRFSDGAVPAASALGGRIVYADINAAAAAVGYKRPSFERASTQPDGTPHIGFTPFFEPALYNSCFSANSLPASAHMTGKMFDRTGRLVAVYEGDADGSGSINTGCFSWNAAYANLAPGYKLNFKVYTPARVFLASFSSPAAPAITFTTVNKATATMGGTGPAGKTYWVWWAHHNLGTNTWTEHDQTDTISGAGTWTNDFLGQFLGSDQLGFQVRPPSTPFVFDRYMEVPRIYCNEGGTVCSLQQFAFKPTTLSIVHGGVTYAFTGRSDQNGWFSAYLESAPGVPIFLVAGDKAGGTLVPQYILPNLTVAAINYTTNVVTGKAPASKHFSLGVNLPYPADQWYNLWVHSDTLGNYTGDFMSQVDLQPVQAINVEVFYWDPVTGNATYFFKAFGP